MLFNSLLNRITPEIFWQFFQERNGIREVVANSGWLIAERLYRLSLGLVVGILIARHLGPEKFGVLSYALSIIGFLGTFVYMGLSGLVVREIIVRKNQTDQIMGTTFAIKLTGSFLALLIVISIAFWFHDTAEYEFWILIIFGLSLLPRPLFQTIDYWFQSQIKSKFTVIAAVNAFSLISIAQIILVLNNSSVIAISIVIAMQFVIEPIIAIAICFYKKLSILKWKPKVSEAIYLFKNSWILIIAVFLEQIYLKMDQVMLRWMVNAKEVGIYAVATRLSEIWYFIPTAIVISAFPKLLELKRSHSINYEIRQQQILDFLFIFGLSVAVLTTTFAKFIIPLLFGDAYIDSSGILIIHIWAGVFVFVGILFHRWVFVENILFFLVINGGIGAITNVTLNIILIPIAHGKGAAIATLLSYSVSSYFCLFLFKKTRPFAIKMNKAFIFPLRLAIYRKNFWS